MKKPALKRIFISYAHEDRDLAEQVSAALPRELPNCRVEVWSDLEIRAGQPWLEEIQRQLEHADVAVLLVSAHYASSEFVASEELPKVMSRYLSRGALLWIPVDDAGNAWADSNSLSDRQAVGDRRVLRSMDPLDVQTALKRMYMEVFQKLDPEGYAVSSNLDPKYHLERQMGTGRTWQVYRAMDRDLGRQVAICVPAGRETSEVSDLLKFTMRRSVHPAIATIYGACLQGSPRHIVCKYADGGLLADRIAKTYEETGRGLPCGEVRELLLRFARALSALSKAGDVPLPVKPGKILLDRSGTYLSPVARVPRTGRNLRDHLAQPGQSTATDRAYIAPEQVSGRPTPVDKTYQYQLGLVAWHAISGTLPRPHDAVDAWKGDKLPTFVPSLPSLNASAPRCSPWLAAIVSRLTAAKPSSRFASLDELVSTLLKLPSEELGLVRQSYDDCLKNARKTFFGLVYTRLQERLSPEEWMKFSNVNWELQHENLAEAIALLLAFHALDDPAMEPTSLSRVARVHEHHGYGSTPGSFAQFGESLVDSVVETLQLEPGDAETLRDAWAAVLKPGLGYLARRVERDAAVRARS